MTNSKSKTVNILLVEDNPGDVRLTIEVLKDAKINNTMRVAHDGEQALKILRQKGKNGQTNRPELILLDLNLPRLNGLEVLREIKTDPILRSIPVVILTSSQSEKDILDSYSEYANAYVIKPVSIQQFVAVVRSIDNFWLEIVQLPEETH
jgi:CheY-like chemotaxis protein